ncbi:hypothetical protein ERO13_D11G002200v2 [Gossypium hirsutum]|uniref:SEED MATURATION PROTEIN 1 n=1 Tax=Gossypium hirsutum TaxID=3635 RepID=A0ABM3B2M7_GOSHI|nr:SEED MATURATION PROTEIN 1-like [Gossypium hirsutum]KAG4118235.1 hypothetical protein ERO13_D11G002200v2 [Gossypium hirsutum]
MAQSTDDIKHATTQAKQSEDESLRVAYKHGTPLEAGKIADSSPVDLFSSAQRVQNSSSPSPPPPQSNTSTATNADSTSSANT